MLRITKDKIEDVKQEEGPAPIEIVKLIRSKKFYFLHDSIKSMAEDGKTTLSVIPEEIEKDKE